MEARTGASSSQKIGTVDDKPRVSDPVAGVVLGPDGQPMAGARVRLFQRKRHWPRRDREELGFVRSGASGQFVFAVGRSYNQEVEVEAIDCATQVRSFPPPGLGDLTVRLERGFTLRGRVLLPNGRPASNCEVFLEPGSGSLMRATRTRSERDGTFAFHGVPVDNLRVTARHPSYQPVTTTSISLGRRATLKFEADGLGVSGKVTSGDKPLAGCRILAYPRTSNGLLFIPFENTTNNLGEFTLRGLGQGLFNIEVRHPHYSSIQRRLSIQRSRTGLVLDLQPKVKVRGRLVGIKKLPAVRMGLVSYYGEVGVAAVQPDGSFEFEDSFSRGMATLELLDGAFSFQASQSRWSRRALMRVGGDLELAIEPAAGVSGSVRGEDGKPVEGVEVLASRKVLEDPWNLLSDPSLLAARRRVLATTDADGRYRVRGLEPGEVQLAFQKEGYAHVQRVAKVTTALAGESGFGTEPPVDLVSPATISGQVQRGGVPVPGALVSIGHGSARAFTGPDGRYTLRGLPAGDHLVRVKFRTLPVAHSDDPIPVRAGQHIDGVDIGLPLGRRITGKIVDDEEISMANVLIESQAGTTTRSDEAGRFELDVPMGRTALQVRAAAFDPVADRVLVHAKEDRVVVRLRRAPRAGLRARVMALPKETPVVGLVLRLDAEEDPVQIASNGFFHVISQLQRLNQHHVRGQVERWVEIPDGELQLQNLPAGNYTLTLHAKGLQPMVKKISLINGRVLDLGEVKLECGLLVRGIVVDPAGQPVAGARVVLGRESDLSLSGARTRYLTDRAGRFAVEGVGLQLKDLFVAAKGYATKRHQLDLEKDILRSPDDPVRVQLRPGATIKALLVDQSGEPVPFRRVQLNRGYQRIGEVETDDQGVAWFHNVSRGSYHVYLLGEIRSLRSQVIGDTQGGRVYEVKVLDAPRRVRRARRPR